MDIYFAGIPYYEASVIFMFFNILLNGFQGLFLLLVYCVVGSEVRKAFRKMLEKSSKFSSLLTKQSKSRSNDIAMTANPKTAHFK